MLRVYLASRLSWSVQFRAPRFFYFFPPILRTNNMAKANPKTFADLLPVREADLLDQFALAALPAIIASYDAAASADKIPLGSLARATIAQDAYQMAQAMLDARELIGLPATNPASHLVASGRPPRPA
jgi:hypothetical protein